MNHNIFFVKIEFHVMQSVSTLGRGVFCLFRQNKRVKKIKKC